MDIIDNFDPLINQFNSRHGEMGGHGINKHIRHEFFKSTWKDKEMTQSFKVPRKEGIVMRIGQITFFNLDQSNFFWLEGQSEKSLHTC